MNEQHETRLAELAEKLVDVFLDEADPAGWSGAGKMSRERTKEERGNRNWDVDVSNKVGLLAARSIDLLQRLEWVRKNRGGAEAGSPPPGGTLGGTPDGEADIHRFRVEADRLLEKIGARRPST